MSEIFGIGESALFQMYVSGQRKAVFPFSLSIVDCFWVVRALGLQSEAQPGGLKLKRISMYGATVESVVVKDAFDLYQLDRDISGAEVVVLDEVSGACCYWDAYERFVVAAGSIEFISQVAPYTEDIEKHYFVETMLLGEECDHLELEKLFASIKRA